MSKVNKVNPESAYCSTRKAEAFNIEDLQRLRHQTAQVQPGQCVHYSQFVVIFTKQLQSVARNLAEENKKNQNAASNVFFIQNGACGCECLTPSQSQGRHGWLWLCGPSHNTPHHT